MRVVDAYGMSETWSGFALDGLPIAGAHVTLDADTSEILVRGDMVMRGYRLDAARTGEVRRADGTLATGDVGTLDADGRVRVVDRLKDLVITGGVNVSPTEIEGVLAQHEGVADVCVVGVPDDEWGERVVAFVVPNGSQAPSVGRAPRVRARAAQRGQAPARGTRRSTRSRAAAAESRCGARYAIGRKHVNAPKNRIKCGDPPNTGSSESTSHARTSARGRPRSTAATQWLTVSW